MRRGSMRSSQSQANEFISPHLQYQGLLAIRRSTIPDNKLDINEKALFPMTNNRLVQQRLKDLKISIKKQQGIGQNHHYYENYIDSARESTHRRRVNSVDEEVCRLFKLKRNSPQTLKNIFLIKTQRT